MTTTPPPRLRLDIWSDIACPWCFIGKRHLEQALAQFGHADAVDIHWRAFELDPQASARKEAGAEGYAARIAKKYGVTAAEGQKMIDRVVGAGARAGIAFDYTQIQPGNTFDAHRLLAWAATLGAAQQGALKERFMRGYMCEGSAIGEREVLVGLAGEAGLDRDEARAVLAGDRFAAEVRADERLAQEARHPRRAVLRDGGPARRVGGAAAGRAGRRAREGVGGRGGRSRYRGRRRCVRPRRLRDLIDTAGVRSLILVVAVAAGAAGCGDNLGISPADLGPLALAFTPVALEGDVPEAITELKFVPGSRDFFVLNKTHTVTHYTLAADGLHAARVGTFDVPGVDETADCGLLSVTFDPGFAQNRFVYFASCDSPTESRITRHVFDATNAYASIAATATTVLRVGDPEAVHAWHNIGSIGFDATGNLWALFGDKDIAPTAQDTSNQLGTVIRVVPGADGASYVPAADNPLLAMPGADPAIAAYGLRSPWRGALDEAGRLWIGDVGDSSFEEVNVTRFRGENFGAGITEGPCTPATSNTGDCIGLVDPVVSWDRSLTHPYSVADPHAVQTSRRVVWVGTAYPRTIGDNDRYGARLFDRMLVGDFAGGWVRAIRLDADDRVDGDEPVGHLEAASSWAVGPDGYLYATTYGSSLAFPYMPGSVLRVRASDDADME